MQPPVLIFGFDAGDPDMLLEWAQDGTLPNLGSILNRGCHARVAGVEMISEHGVWPGLVSGVSRSKHGYYYHRQLVPGTYDLLPARGRHLDAKPFWTHYKDRKVAIIDVPDIAAPEPQPGFQLSEWATHYPYFGPTTEPEHLLARVRSKFGAQMVIHEYPGCAEEKDLELFQQMLDRINKKKALCQDLLGEDQFDLTFVVYGESHTGAHQFWKYQELDGELQHAIRELYRQIDAAMGDILDIMPPETKVFVVSSVGMKEQWPAAGLNESFTRSLGYQIAPESSGSPGLMSLARRFVPQIVRDQLSRFLSREKQDELISQKFSTGTDWSRTRAFSIPAYYTGQFRVNLKGREPHGIVKPGADYEKTLDDIESDLLKLIDPVTNRPAIKAVRRTAELFGTGPPETLPDIFAEWEDAVHFVERVVHPNCELTQTPGEFHRSTDHSQYGFLAAAGPGIESAGFIGDVSLVDLAATFMTHLDSEIRAQTDGHPIKEMSAS